MLRYAFILAGVVFLAAGLYFSTGFYRQPPPPPVYPVKNSDLVGNYRPDFRLGSSTGEFVTPADFEGKTLLINFWATWCEPCLKETPMLVELQSEYGAAGLQVIGIALDDIKAVREFSEKLGVSYPILLGTTDALETISAYGNVAGMLPFSVLVDKDGIIRWQYMGEIRHEEISNLLVGLL